MGVLRASSKDFPYKSSVVVATDTIKVNIVLFSRPDPCHFWTTPPKSISFFLCGGFAGRWGRMCYQCSDPLRIIIDFFKPYPRIITESRILFESVVLIMKDHNGDNHLWTWCLSQIGSYWPCHVNLVLSFHLAFIHLNFGINKADLANLCFRMNKCSCHYF